MPSKTPALVDVDALAERLAERRAVVLDVRTPGEFSTSAIEGSYHVPLDQLDQHLAELRRADKEIAVVCRSGERSSTAYEKLASAGVDNVSVLDGGLIAWQQAGQPLQSGEGKWEMERQVRLAAGSLVLAGVVTSFWWSPARLFSGAIGAGLSIAALTNTCVMSRALMKLPYNRVSRKEAHDNVERLVQAA